MKLEDHCFNAAPPGQRDAVSCVTLSMAIAAIEQARRNGAVEARNELLGGISLAKTPLTLDECIIMYRDAVRRMRQAEAKAEQARKDDKQHIEILEHNLAALQGDDWRHAIDQELSNWHTTADSYATPREAVKALIAFEVMTALDPKVSSDAAALVEKAREEEREECAKLCEQTGPDDWTGYNCAAAIRARKP